MKRTIDRVADASVAAGEAADLLRRGGLGRGFTGGRVRASIGSPAKGSFPLNQSDPTAFAPPGSFGPFRVLHQIGTGVLGPVFRTYEPARDRLVAVKAFRLDLTPEQAHALADELGRIGEAPLEHPSIVRPLAAGVEGSLPYLALEYVAAESLDIAMRHYAPAPIDRLLPFVTQLAGAIDFARAAGIGHGALHPRDIFVTPDDARATGFGVVQALERIGRRAPVRRPYTAPERVDGGAWDVRADVYSLGAIAYELLTGKRCVGSNVGHLGETAGPHAALLASVLTRALAGDPGDRYATALAFAAALDAASRGERTPPAAEQARAAAPVPAVPAEDERLKAPPAAAKALSTGSLDSVAQSEADEVPACREDEAASVEPLEHAPADRVPLCAVPAATDQGQRELTFEPEYEQTAADAEVDDIVIERHADLADIRLREREADIRLREREADIHLREREALEEEEAAPEPEPKPVAPVIERVFAQPPSPIHVPEGEEPRPVRAREQRPVLFLPVAFTLLLGLFVGFLAGYLVGSRETAQPLSETIGSGGTPESGAAPTSGEQGAQTEARPDADRARAGAPAPSRATQGQSAASGTASAPRSPSTSAPATRASSTSPARTAAAGRLIVRSTPPGALVYLNGRRRGSTPLAIRGLAPGTYTVRVARSGYRDQTQRVSVSASGTRDISFRLQRPPAPPPASTSTYTGSIFVDSRPRGARVFLDGRAVGETPVQVADISAGTHVVRLELPDHRPWTTSTRVVAGQVVRVAASLERQP